MRPTIRRLTAADLPAVQHILYLAAGWNEPKGLPPIEVAMEHPTLAMYYESWGREGDDGCVAELDGRFAGGAFYRLFTEDVHGDGFISPEVPELAVAVVAECRGQGIGRRLMTELADIAVDDDLAKLSLSVHKPNPARRLYEDLGYQSIEDHGDSVLMVLSLDGS